MKVLFLAYTKNGLGHHYRTKAVAQEAVRRGHNVIFLSDRREYIEGAVCYKLKPYDSGQYEAIRLGFSPDWVVADLPEPTPPSWLKADRLCLIDGSPKHCDLAIGQGFGGLLYEAPEYIIIPPELRQLNFPAPPAECWFVWGGAKDVRGILSYFGRNVNADALLLMAEDITPEPQVVKERHFLTCNGVDDRVGFWRFALDCDKGCVQMGHTVWELIYMGMPCWVFSHDERNLQTAHELAKRGWVMAWPDVGLPNRPKAFIEFLKRDFELGQKPVDGRGAERIVKLMEAKL